MVVEAVGLQAVFTKLLGTFLISMALKTERLEEQESQYPA